MKILWISVQISNCVMVGEGMRMNWLEQVVPAMEPTVGASGEQYSLQGVEGNFGPSIGFFGDYMGSNDVLREVQDSDLEDEYFNG